MAEGKHEFVIFVNNKQFKTDQTELTGDQIKALASVPSNYELFRVEGDKSMPVGPNEEVKISNGEHFRAIPPGTFGVDASNATS
jgi:multiubiquitin